MTPDRLQLEQEIVYACVQNPIGFIRNSRALAAELFLSPVERKAMMAIHRLSDTGVEVNWINVQNEMGEHIALPESMSYGIADLNIAAKRLAELVILDKRTRLVDTLQNEDDPFSVIAEINQAANEYASLLAMHSRIPKDVMLAEYIDTVQRNKDGNILRIPTGFPTLDRWCHGGLKLGNMSFLGGSPGSGKTSFMLKLGMNAAGRGHKAVLIEGEMPADEILSRLAGQWTKLPVHELERGDHLDGTLEFCEQFQKMTYDVQITFDRSVNALLAKIREACHEGAKLIMVDYLQVFVEKGGRSSDEFTKIKALSEGLRKMTLVNNIHIIAASSLNRLDHGATKLTLNSFYGGSQLGHDCNTALILSNESDEVSAEAKNRTIVCDVVKNRGGRTGQMQINYALESQDMVEQADVLVNNLIPFNERGSDEHEPF